MSYIDELNAPKSVTSSGYGSVQDLCDKFAIACAEVDRLRVENRELVAALEIIPPFKMLAIAAYLDATDVKLGEKGTEVQDDLRRMSAASRTALDAARASRTTEGAGS